MDFRNLILNIPSQIGFGIKASFDIKIKKPRQIIICGMGGSALAGEFLRAVFDEYEIKIPLILHKDYDLPRSALPDSFVVCASFSGNTEETISAYQKALGLKDAQMLAMASGGMLEKLASEIATPMARDDKYKCHCEDRSDKAISFIKIDLGSIPPRLTTLFMFSALVNILVNSDILPGNALDFLKSSVQNINVSELENFASAVAVKIADKTPLIYSSLRLQPLAYFLKISFNENAKIHAFANVLPESQHNEIQGFSDASLSGRFYAIFLKDGENEKMISRRIDIMAQMISKRRFDYFVIDVAGKNIFEKIAFALLLGSFLPLNLAQLKNQDPFTNILIDELKNALKS